MSSDFERRLREGRSALPDPESELTNHARERALAALRRRRRLRPLLVATVMVVVAVALGIGIGASVAPSGTAAEGPVGFGFLPVSGWYVMQNGAEGTPEQPAIAIASNVPIDPADGGSIVPYATLLNLARGDVVMVANFTGPVTYPTGGFAARRTPLEVADAVSSIQFGAQVRPERPLGQYQLRGVVKGNAVEVHFYFGSPSPSAELVAEAQRQLERLVVAPEHPGAEPRSGARAATQRLTASRSVDRTFLCTPSYGRAKIVASPHDTLEVLGTRFVSSGYARLTTGPESDPLNDLAVIARPGLRNGGTRFPASVYASVTRCVPSRTAVPLTQAGLPGSAVLFRSDADCMAQRVLVRVRAQLRAPVVWRRLRGPVGSAYVGVGGRIVEAELAVRDPATGRPLAYVTLSRAGKTKLWTRC